MVDATEKVSNGTSPRGRGGRGGFRGRGGRGGFGGGRSFGQKPRVSKAAKSRNCTILAYYCFTHQCQTLKRHGAKKI